MASQPARIRSGRRLINGSLPRPRAAVPRDLDDPDLIPPSFREKVDLAAVGASLDRQIEKIRAGQARGIDAEDVLRELDDFIASLAPKRRKPPME